MASEQRSDRGIDVRGTLAVLGNILIWGAAPVLLKMLTEDIDAWTSNGLRYPIAALLLLPFLLRAAARGELTPDLMKRAIFPASLAFIGQILWTWSPYFLQANLIGFLIKTSTIWAIVGSMILFVDERALLRRPRFHVGLAFAFAGCTTLAFEQQAFDGDATTVGILLVVGCGVFFGFYAVSIRRYLSGVSPLISFGIVAQYVSVGSVVLALFFGETGAVAAMTSRAWTLVLVSAVFSVCISHLLMYVALLRLGASLTSSAQMLSPFVTYSVAVVFLSEGMSVRSWMACLVLLIGGVTLLSSQKNLPRHRIAAPPPPRSQEQ